MSDLHDRPAVRLTGSLNFGESHLLPDAVVAFVDNELSLDAHERAATHLAHCPSCASDVDAQRTARAAVTSCQTPDMPAGLLASLQSIPDSATLSTTPDNLAVTDDGQLVAVQRPQATPFGSRPLGSGSRGGIRGNRRAVQGAGVVMSGLVAGALALALSVESDREPPAPTGTDDNNRGVVPAGLPSPTTAPSSADGVLKLNR